MLIERIIDLTGKIHNCVYTGIVRIQNVAFQTITEV